MKTKQVVQDYSRGYTDSERWRVKIYLLAKRNCGPQWFYRIIAEKVFGKNFTRGNVAFVGRVAKDEKLGANYFRSGKAPESRQLLHQTSSKVSLRLSRGTPIRQSKVG